MGPDELGLALGEGSLELLPGVDLHLVRLAEGEGAIEEELLEGVEALADLDPQVVPGEQLLLGLAALVRLGDAHLAHDRALLEVAGADLEAHRHALALPLEVLGARLHPVALVDLDEEAVVAQVLGDLVRGLEDGRALLVLAVDRHDHHVDGGHARRQHEAVVVRVRHDQGADQARGDAPAGLPDVLTLAGRVLEHHVEGLAEVLAQVVARAALQRLAVLHHPLDGARLEGTGEALVGALDAADDRDGEDVPHVVAVDVQHPLDLLLRLLVRGVGRVPLLPLELTRAQEHPRPQLPAHDVAPLVDQQRQVAMAVDPLAEEVADDGLRGRTDDVGLLQLLPPGVRHDRELGREALHVLRLLLDEAHGDEQREGGVLVSGGLEALVEVALDRLPDGEAVRPDDHAALHDVGRLGELGLGDDVLVPLGVVLGTGRDAGFRHGLWILFRGPRRALRSAEGRRGARGRPQAPGEGLRGGGRWPRMALRGSPRPVP